MEGAQVAILAIDERVSAESFFVTFVKEGDLALDLASLGVGVCRKLRSLDAMGFGVLNPSAEGVERAAMGVILSKDLETAFSMERFALLLKEADLKRPRDQACGLWCGEQERIKQGIGCFCV